MILEMRFYFLSQKWVFVPAKSIDKNSALNSNRYFPLVGDQKYI